MESLSKRIDVRLVSNKTDYLKYRSKPIYISQNVIHKHLVTIRDNKVTFNQRNVE